MLNDLAVAQPHEARARGYTTIEWPIYCAGYYHALSVAMKALSLAAERFAHARRTNRQATRAARRRAGVA